MGLSLSLQCNAFGGRDTTEDAAEITARLPERLCKRKENLGEIRSAGAGGVARE